MTIKISLVGTSFLNKKHEIRKCINSVLAQNYKNYEFIIILEKEDKNLFLFKEFEKKNKKIKVFLNKQEPGLASCLNQGVKKSKGEFIGRIDFDDLYFSDKLQKQIYYLKKNKHVDICGTNAWFFEKKEIYKKKICINHNAIKKNFFFYNSIIHPSVLLKKKILFKYGLYNKNFKYAEDLELWMRLLKNNVIFHNLPDKLMKYNIKNINQARNKLNYYYNYLARKKHSVGVYGYFLGNLNIFIFFLINFFSQNLINFIIGIANSFRYKK